MVTYTSVQGGVGYVGCTTNVKFSIDSIVWQ
jgi:hypothetical protein